MLKILCTFERNTKFSAPLKETQNSLHLWKKHKILGDSERHTKFSGTFHWRQSDKSTHISCMFLIILVISFLLY